jgi:signal peptidase II
MKSNSFFFGFVLFWVAVDQLVKLTVVKTVALYESVPVIPGFFNLTRVHNKGAIFGAFSKSGSSLVFVALTAASILALVFVVYFFFKTPPKERLMKLSLSLILAGALGNLLDRILRGHVIDFLDFYVGKWHWPFFNVADSCITIGAFLMLFIFLRRKPECTPSS